MRFDGETRTIFKPGAARWALLFMGGFCGTLRLVAGKKKQIPRPKATFGMTTPCTLRRSAAVRAASFGMNQKADPSAKAFGMTILYVLAQRRSENGAGKIAGQRPALRCAGGSPASFGTNRKADSSAKAFGMTILYVLAHGRGENGAGKIAGQRPALRCAGELPHEPKSRFLGRMQPFGMTTFTLFGARSK